MGGDSGGSCAYVGGMDIYRTLARTDLGPDREDQAKALGCLRSVRREGEKRQCTTHRRVWGESKFRKHRTCREEKRK